MATLSSSSRSDEYSEDSEAEASMKKMQPTRWMPANGKEGKLERFISQNGSSEFEALLDQTEVDLFELNRPSVVERTFPSLIGINRHSKPSPATGKGFCVIA